MRPAGLCRAIALEQAATGEPQAVIVSIIEAAGLIFRPILACFDNLQNEAAGVGHSPGRSSRAVSLLKREKLAH